MPHNGDRVCVARKIVVAEDQVATTFCKFSSVKR